MVYRRVGTNKRRSYRKRPVYRKRRYTRRSYGNKRGTGNMLSKTLSAGFPNMYITKLKYTETTNLNAATGVVAYHAFRGNGIYDPNYTGTGHQPLGYDAFASLYKTYIVIGSKMTVRFLSQDNTTTPVIVGIITREAPTMAGLTDATTIMEQGNNRYRIINSRDANTGGVDPRIVVSKWSLKKWFGIKDWRDNSYGFGAAMGSDATRPVYLIPYVGDLTGSQDLGNIIAVVTIEYIVAFTEPLPQYQS